jgi:biotin carboxyl carrier protein
MSKQLRVKVNGNPYEVEVKDFAGTSAEVVVNGTTYSIEVEEVGGIETPIIKTPVAPSIPTPVKPAPAAVPQAPAPAVTIASAGASDVISAPMPGVIMDIAVKTGDKITAGDTVCALEAMKMKNMLRSPRDGTVASVEVNEGQRVPFGAVIIRFA